MLQCNMYTWVLGKHCLNYELREYYYLMEASFKMGGRAEFCCSVSTDGLTFYVLITLRLHLPTQKYFGKQALFLFRKKYCLLIIPSKYT